jgi:hypothetical protein
MHRVCRDRDITRGNRDLIRDKDITRGNSKGNLSINNDFFIMNDLKAS